MELEHSTAAGLSVLLRPRGGGSVAARGGCAEAAVPGQTTTTLTPSSTLSTAVPEMLAASRRNAAGKRPRGPCHPPPDAESQGSCGAAAKEAVLPTARMQQALAKRVARRMLRRRGASPPAPDHGGTKVVLTCCCERLPPGLCCALHQRGGAPCRPWTRDGGGAARGWAFGEYARWRRSVWVPSRFYLERAGVGPGERAAPGPALLVERTARCAGVSVRRFLLVGGDPPERSVSGM